MKKNRFDLFSFVLGIIMMMTFGVGAALLYNAKDIEFIPVNDNWNVNNVEDAIDDLYNNYIPKSEFKDKTWTFDYTGNAQTFVVPVKATYRVELWGASGQDYNSILGGKGSYTSGEIELNKNDALYIYVGGSGKGFNGNETISSSSSIIPALGGGSTDVRLFGGSWDDFDSLKSRIMVAAGGSGAALLAGVPGGGLTGYSSSGKEPTQTTIGTGTNNGGFGITPLPSYFSGAGNGYYSGATGIYTESWSRCATETGTCSVGSGNIAYVRYCSTSNVCASNKWFSSSISCSNSVFGDPDNGKTKYCDVIYVSNMVSGSGSSYISGHDGCDSISSLSTSTNLIHTGSSIHYSNKKFNNTRMIDGYGYEWTTKKSNEVSGMPNKDGIGLTAGNSGNGYAKITLVSID